MKKSILLVIPFALLAFGCGRRNNTKDPSKTVTTKATSTKEQPTTKEDPTPITNKNIYVSYNGKATSDGSDESNPTTLEHVLDPSAKLLNSGDTIYLAKGKYIYNDTLQINLSGNESKRNKLIALEGATFDFDSTKGDSKSNNGGLSITGSYWQIENITVINSDNFGFDITGKENKLINCTADKNSNGGFGIKNTSVISLNNCVSTNNELEGYSARGFYIKGSGESIFFDSCVATNNQDSGFYVESSLAKKLYFNKCLSSDNGLKYSTSIDRSGFSFKNNQHYFTDCIAYNNGLYGFLVSTATTEKGEYTLTNCSAINNHEKNYSLDTNRTTTVKVTNALSYNDYKNSDYKTATNDFLVGNVVNSLIFYSNSDEKGYFYIKSEKDFKKIDTTRETDTFSTYTHKYKINMIIPHEMEGDDGKIIYYKNNEIYLYDYLDRSIDFQDEFFSKQTPSITNPTYFGANINGDAN